MIERRQNQHFYKNIEIIGVDGMDSELLQLFISWELASLSWSNSPYPEMLFLFCFGRWDDCVGGDDNYKSWAKFTMICVSAFYK